MAEEDKPDEKPEQAPEAADVATNPDLEKETEGMVDLSDVLATGDNETGASDAADAIAATDGDEASVDLFEENANKPTEAETEDKPGFFDKLMLKLFPEESTQKFILDKVTDKIVGNFHKAKEAAKSGKERAKKFAKEDSKEIAAYCLEKLKEFAGLLGKEIKDFLSLKWKVKSFFIAGIILALVTVVVFNKSLEGQLIPEAKKTYILNFNEVADKIYPIAAEDKWEKFRNPLRFPEYVVRFDRLIVMLKRSQFSSQSPMGVFALYFETSSQEAATELKFRESEMRDVAARTLEGITYDEIRSFEGKKKAKKALIQSINKVLNQGKLINIYFKDFVLKP
jgi:flagellar basal body-associated protein FliL